MVLAATTIEMIRSNEAWLMTREGREALKLAQSIVKGSEWEGVLYPNKNRVLPKNLFRLD